VKLGKRQMRDGEEKGRVKDGWKAEGREEE
jgi:hypothetical protein